IRDFERDLCNPVYENVVPQPTIDRLGIRYDPERRWTEPPSCEAADKKSTKITSDNVHTIAFHYYHRYCLNAANPKHRAGERKSLSKSEYRVIESAASSCFPSASQHSRLMM
ncbi:hypothetical protein X777_01646, partial [Ooceraea biroi]